MSDPAFGFSAGDFIAGNASDEYRSPVQELALLERILKQLYASQGQGSNNVFAADVAQQTDLALTTMRGSFEAISNFEAKLGNQAPSAWHHGTPRKAWWAVGYTKEIEKLQVNAGVI